MLIEFFFLLENVNWVNSYTKCFLLLKFLSFLINNGRCMDCLVHISKENAFVGSPCTQCSVDTNLVSSAFFTRFNASLFCSISPQKILNVSSGTFLKLLLSLFYCSCFSRLWIIITLFTSCTWFVVNFALARTPLWWFCWYLSKCVCYVL